MTDWLLVHETDPTRTHIVAPGITGASLRLPVIEFPSEITLPVLSCEADNSRDVVLLGDLQIPVYATRNQALSGIRYAADSCGYLVQKKGKTDIRLWRGGQTALLTFDNDQPRLVDVKIKKVEAK